ncbi:unnamed protein product [Durusdinium trenchii]|uniref:Carrier domain-containing protein n=1 Tax=Durusdinium trenchii TaxID=1381693 RepID=A0ABP0J1H2_9DINO
MCDGERHDVRSPEAEDLATRSEDLAAVVDEEDLEPSSAMAAALAAMASAVQTLQNTPEPVMESGGQVVDEDDDDTVAAEVPPEPCEVEVDLEVDLEEETFRPTPPSTPAPSAPSPVPQLLEGLRAANRMKSQEVQSENLTLEELEDQLLLQKVLVKQLKADYEQRLERSEALAAELRDLQGSKPQDLQVKVVRARDETEKLSKEGNRAAMWVEDRLARAWRLFQSRTPSQRLARDLAKKSHAELEALRRSRGHVEEDVALEVLQSQRRRIDVMKQDATAQDEKLLSLGSDLRSVLDFMVRVNLDARGGPNGPLGELPELQNLNFSEEVMTKYAVLTSLTVRWLSTGDQVRYLENSGSPSQLRRAAQLATAPSLASAAQQMQRRPQLPLPSHEREAFGEERQLLRSRLMTEMQQVAEVLARPEPKKSAGPEELLRAAAWGELRTLKELLSVPMEATEELCGWTVWHSAAAHGQDKVIRFLQEHATEGLDALCDCGLPPLGITCLRGHLGTAKCLLEAKCTVSAHDVRGNSALHWAAASHSHQAAEELAELLLDASADPFACNGSGQLPDIPRLQELALRSSERRDSVPRSPRPRTDAAPPDAARHGAGGEEEVPRFSYISLEKKSTSGGFLSSLSFLKPPVRDRAGLMRRAEARRAVHLSPEEEDVGIWSDWVTVFTHAGLSACVAPAPAPSSDPTNSACNTQALVLTSERLLFLRAASTGAAVRSGWSLAQGMALRQIRQVVIPGRSDGLLLLRVQTSDEVLHFHTGSRETFLEELWQAMLRAGWPNRAVDASDDGSAVKDFFCVDPEPVIPLLDLAMQEAAQGTLAFLSGNLFVLLPRAPSSLLLSGAETIRFGFLELQMRRQPKQAGAGVCWQWQRYFFLAKGGRPHERCLGWCLHPNAEKWTGHILLQSVTQVKSVRGSAGEACVVIQSQNQIVATVKARGSREREDWLDALRRLGGNSSPSYPMGADALHLRRLSCSKGTKKRCHDKPPYDRRSGPATRPDRHVARQPGPADQAMRVAQELVTLCNDKHDGKREAIARLMVANIHYNMKDFTQCILVAREAQVLLHDLSAFIDEAAAVRMVAEAYLANGELPQAVKAAERSLRLLKGKRKEAEEIQSMLVLASVKLQVLVQDKVRAQRGTPTFNVALEDALDAAEQAVHLAREKRMAQLGQALLTLGQAQLAGLRIDEALKTAAEAMEIAEAAGAEREKANVMCLEADIHFTNGNANKALVLVNKALAIFQEYRDSRGEWIAMNILEQITGPPEDPAALQQGDWTEEQWAQWNAWQQQQGQQGGSQVPQAIQRATEEPRARRRTDPGEKLELAHVSTDTVRKRVEEIVRFTADLDDNEPIELDQPLMQVGVTSRTAVGLRNMLSEELPGVDLPFTLIFDYPSVASISDHVMDSLGAVG